MKQVVADLRTEHNVYTVPYVNGRLFDVGSDSYSHPAGTGDAVCCASPAEPALGPFQPSQLAYTAESYGSGATFHVADPSAQWWQHRYRDVVEGLVGGKPKSIRNTFLPRLGMLEKTDGLLCPPSEESDAIQSINDLPMR